MEHNVGNRSCCLLVFLLLGHKCELFELLAWFPDLKPCQVNLYVDVDVEILFCFCKQQIYKFRVKVRFRG